MKKSVLSSIIVFIGLLEAPPVCKAIEGYNETPAINAETADKIKIKSSETARYLPKEIQTIFDVNYKSMN